VPEFRKFPQLSPVTRFFQTGVFGPPIGKKRHQHPYALQATARETGGILIPPQRTPIPPLTPSPTPTGQPAADNNPKPAAAAVNQPHPTATETKISSGSFTFSSKNDVEDTNPAPTPDAESPNSNILWGRQRQQHSALTPPPPKNAEKNAKKPQPAPKPPQPKKPPNSTKPNGKERFKTTCKGWLLKKRRRQKNKPASLENKLCKKRH